MRPLSALAHATEGARARREPLPKWRMTPGNFSTVTSLALPRERAKSVRASYKRDWEVLKNIELENFNWESLEGHGDADSRQENLLRYIENHLPLIERYGRQIRSSEFASRRWAAAKRSGVSRRYAWVDLNAAIEEELRRSEGEVENLLRILETMALKRLKCFASRYSMLLATRASSAK